MNVSDSETRKVRRGQLFLFSAIAAVVLGVFAAWLSAGGGDVPALSTGIDAELAGEGTAEAGWVRNSEVRLGGIEAQLRDIEARNLRLRQDNAGLQAQLRDNAEDARSVIDSLLAEIEPFRRESDSLQADNWEAPGTGSVEGNGFFSGAGNANSPASNAAAAPVLSDSPMMLEFNLDAGAAPETADETLRTGEASKPLGAYVPAGGYAEAVVMAGADASVGVASQGDPRPVLLRLTGPAYSAADKGTAAEVDLAGCTVTGAAYGDLSSEKVYVRLQTLACTGQTPGTVIETEVAGFVAGAGKAGVRGPVVSREGALIEKAFLSGLVSGIGQGVSSAFQPQAVASGGAAAIANTGLADIGRAGLGAGAASTGQKVSDYLIRRAEQYQPVIQLQAGTRVTVVFLEGAWLDGRGE